MSAGRFLATPRPFSKPRTVRALNKCCSAHALPIPRGRGRRSSAGCMRPSLRVPMRFARVTASGRSASGAPGAAAGLAIRRTLGESRDHELLTAAGWFLARGVRGPSQFREFDPDYWAEWCYRRALRVQPAAIVAHTELLEIRSRQSWSRGEPLWSEPPARAYESVAALPEAERFELLPDLARTACQRLESMARWDDDPLIRDRMEQSKRDAKRYAEDALALAPRYRDHPEYRHRHLPGEHDARHAGAS